MKATKKVEASIKRTARKLVKAAAELKGKELKNEIVRSFMGELDEELGRQEIWFMDVVKKSLASLWKTDVVKTKRVVKATKKIANTPRTAKPVAKPIKKARKARKARAVTSKDATVVEMTPPVAVVETVTPTLVESPPAPQA